MKKLKYIVSLIVLALCTSLPLQAQDNILTAIGVSGQTWVEVPTEAKDINFANTGGSKTIKVKTNTTVKPRTTAKWINTSIDADGETITVTAAENTDKEIRRGVVVLAAPDGASQQINVAQLGTAPAFIITDDTLHVKGINAGVLLNITTNSDIVFTQSDWISPKDVETLVGTKSYTFIAGKMKQGTRYGEIKIALASKPSETTSVVVEQNFEGYPTFIVMSDIHIGVSGSEQKVSTSLKNIYENTSDVDALIINGDLTNNGNLEQYQKMTAVINNYDIIPDYTARYFVMGNHEWHTSDGNGSMNNFNSLGVEHDKYFDIKGYPFIYIGMSGRNEDDYSEESLKFLKESLDDATKRYPGKPIFVFQHIPAYATVQGSNPYDGGWGSKKVYDVLKDYPQVFDFSGHTHFSSRCPLTFHQDKFTSLNDGGNYSCYVQRGIDVDGEQPAGTSSLAEGMIVMVEDENNFSVRRIDCARNEEIGETLEFPAPYDGSNFTYAAYRGSKPVFEEGNTDIVSEQFQPTERKITFPQAVIPEDDANDVVLYYRVEIVNNENKVVATANRCSRFYLGSDMPETLDVFVDSINETGMMRIRVTAIDPYGNESEPIESEEFEQGEYKPAEGTEVPTADLFELYVDEQGVGYDHSPMSNKVITSGNAPVPFYDSDYKLTGAKFNGNRSQYYEVDFSDNEKIKTALTSSFTMESFFVCSNLDVGEQTPFSTQQSGGAGYWITSGGVLHMYIGHGNRQWYDLVSTKNLQPGKYYHAVATYDGATLKLYLNGYLAGELAIEDDINLPVEGSQYLVAGGDVSDNPLNVCDAPLNGNLMTARLYSRPISRDEVYVLYQDVIKGNKSQAEDTTIAEVAPVADLFNVEFGENGTATDVSEQQIPVMVGTTTPETYYNETYKRWAAKFPGDDGNCFFGVPYADNERILEAMQADFTLEALCMINNENLLSLPAVLSSQQQGGVGIEPGNVIQGWGYFSGSYATAYAYDYPVKKNTYYHVVLVVQTVDVDAPVMSIYVDGNFGGKVQLAGALTLPQGDAKFFCIGGDASYDGDHAEFLLNGEVALARMYGHALSLPEIKRLYVDLKK